VNYSIRKNDKGELVVVTTEGKSLTNPLAQPKQITETYNPDKPRESFINRFNRNFEESKLNKYLSNSKAVEYIGAPLEAVVMALMPKEKLANYKPAYISEERYGTPKDIAKSMGENTLEMGSLATAAMQPVTALQSVAYSDAAKMADNIKNKKPLTEGLGEASKRGVETSAVLVLTNAATDKALGAVAKNFSPKVSKSITGLIGTNTQLPFKYSKLATDQLLKNQLFKEGVKRTIARAIVETPAEATAFGTIKAIKNKENVIKSIAREIPDSLAGNLLFAGANIGFKGADVYLGDTFKGIGNIVKTNLKNIGVNEKGFINPKAKIGGSGKSDIGGIKDNLLEEARKYKSAEEFIDLYHGTAVGDMRQIKLTKAGGEGVVKTGRELGDYIYLSKNPEVSKQYTGVGGNLINFKAGNDFKIKEYKGTPSKAEIAVQFKKGFDAVSVNDGEQVVIKNANKLVSGTQREFLNRFKTLDEATDTLRNDFINRLKKAGYTDDLIKRELPQFDRYEAVRAGEAIKYGLTLDDINKHYNQANKVGGIKLDNKKPFVVLDKDIQLKKGVGGDAPNINRMAWGEHFTDDPVLAAEYGKVIDGDKLPKGTKIANLDYLKGNYAKNQQLADPKAISQQLLDGGYDYAAGTLPTGKVEVVRLQASRQGWDEMSDWMPGEPISVKGKYAVLDELDDMGEATGRYALAEENKGIIKTFDRINDAEKYGDNLANKVGGVQPRTPNGRYDFNNKLTDKDILDSKLKELTKKEIKFTEDGRFPPMNMKDKKFYDKLMTKRARLLGQRY